MFNSSFRINPDLSPLQNLDQFLWDLEQIVAEDLQHEDSRVASALEEVASMAHKLLNSARAFQPAGQITTLAILDVMVPIEEKARKALLENDIAQRSLQLALIKESSTRIYQQLKRVQDFIGVVRTFELGGATRVYLEEMSALYLDGRTVSVYIIARAALEESLEAKLDGRGLREQRIGLDLRALINLAHRERLISTAPLKEQAHTLRDWGNWAVHDHNRLVESGADALAAIKSLSAVLKDLSRP
jgi:hypothetical protein